MPKKTDAVRLELAIDGMHCASCAQAVEQALAKIAGVHSASVNLLSEQASVETEATVPLQTLVDAVEKAGYTARPLTSGASSETLSRRLPITGMSCASCSLAVEKALLAVPGVESASVALASEEAFIALSEPVANDVLAAAVRGAGYDVARETKRDDVFERDRKRLLEASGGRASPGFWRFRLWAG